jgi:hypothetical protein
MDQFSVDFVGHSRNIYQVSVHVAEGFKRRLKCEKLTEDECQVMVKAQIAFGKVS